MSEGRKVKNFDKQSAQRRLTRSQSKTQLEFSRLQSSSRESVLSEPGPSRIFAEIQRPSSANVSVEIPVAKKVETEFTRLRISEEHTIQRQEEKSSPSSSGRSKGSASSENLQATDSSPYTTAETTAEKKMVYERFSDAAFGFANGDFYDAQAYRELKRQLSTVNFAIQDARSETIALIRRFIDSPLEIPFDEENRFPERKRVLSASDRWFRNLQKAVVTLSYKPANKDLKRKMEKAGPSKEPEELEEGIKDDVTRAWFGVVENLGVTGADFWNRERVERVFDLRWV